MKMMVIEATTNTILESTSWSLNNSTTSKPINLSSGTNLPIRMNLLNERFLSLPSELILKSQLTRLRSLSDHHQKITKQNKAKPNGDNNNKRSAH
ncbi:hypothetical protein BLOT_001167 [Blomia tropicalis]|nr:hypothetical protein BLOT_001167 [Blomia tropicalis]